MALSHLQADAASKLSEIHYQLFNLFCDFFVLKNEEGQEPFFM